MATLNEQTRREVGKYVETRRLSLGLSIAEVSKRAGLSDTKWYQVEKGTSNHKPLTLRKVALALGETPGRIFEVAGLPYSEDGSEATPDLADRVSTLEADLGKVQKTVAKIADHLGLRG